MNKSVCVLGAGDWGKNHIKTLYSLGALGGIVETNVKNLNLISNDYPKIQCYDNLNDALHQGYDGYIISTPAKTHFSLAKKIISAKKPVLIEKPMALSIEDAKEIYLLSKLNNVNVMVGHVMLFHPAIEKIKQIIDSRGIGKLQYIYSNRLNLGKVRTEENVFWSLAPHDIAIFQYLTGSKPVHVHSNGSTFLQEGIPDSTITQLTYKDGVKGHIFVSWLHPFKEHRLVVVGSKAMISFEDSAQDKPLKLYSKQINLGKGMPQKIDGPIELIQYDKKFPLEKELEYFINSFDGSPLKIANAKQGLDVVEILVKSSKQLLV
tara:strand:- start:1345 stop:2304 length:960 start_codon:yes stop_codon:yes gene_type:complete